MGVVVREVYRQNLESEFLLIMKHLPLFYIVSMDTEFPGTVFDPDEGVPGHLRSTRSKKELYKVMKENVDSLELIQIGLTLSDADGKLPTVDGTQVVWEFNFRDFDYETGKKNEESISLLQRQGIDFARNKKDGISSSEFAKLFGDCWLDNKELGNYLFGQVRVEWVTFHGTYDFGFLIKVLTQKPLPADLDGFEEEVGRYFGPEAYDVKMLMREHRLHGGLDRVAKSLDVDRVAGKSHQAGSDSLLTMDVYHKLRKRSWNDEKMITKMLELNHIVYGLTTVS